MNNTFIRKNHLGFKSYVLIGSLLAGGFCGSPAKAMDESLEEKMRSAATVSHEAAWKQYEHNPNVAARQISTGAIVVDGHTLAILSKGTPDHPLEHTLLVSDPSGKCQGCQLMMKKGTEEIRNPKIPENAHKENHELLSTIESQKKGIRDFERHAETKWKEWEEREQALVDRENAWKEREIAQRMQVETLNTILSQERLEKQKMHNKIKSLQVLLDDKAQREEEWDGKKIKSQQKEIEELKAKITMDLGFLNKVLEQ